VVSTSDAATGVAIVLSLLVGLGMIGVWVYRDASAHASRGRPATGSLGTLQLRTPAAWTMACVLLPEVALLAYVDNRTPA
jgi:hypothetical protein